MIVKGTEMRKEDLEKGSTVNRTERGGSCLRDASERILASPLPVPSSLRPLTLYLRLTNLRNLFTNIRI